MSSSNPNFIAWFYISVLEADYGKSVEPRCVKHHVVVFLLVSIHGDSTKVGTLNLSGPTDDPVGDLQRTMLNHTLDGNEGCDYVAIPGA